MTTILSIFVHNIIDDKNKLFLIFNAEIILKIVIIKI